EKGADVVMLGEAEVTFKKMLDGVDFSKKSLKKVRGIVFKDENKVGKRFVNTGAPEEIELDKLPIPDREIHRLSDYVRVKDEINNLGAILSSRGCTGRCSFCFHSLFGKCFRFRSADNVIKEIKYLNEKYGITSIDFVDDALTVNKKRLIEICNKIVEQGIDIEWVCASRIDFLDKELIFKMKQAGCGMISLGVESCIPETLKRTKKTGNPEWYVKHTDKVLKWCQEAGIRAGVNTLVGFPWETADDMKYFQKYVKKISPYVTQCFDGGIVQPQPGTEVYNEYAKKYGFENWWLEREPLFKDDYRPFFMTYYHTFWDHLHNNFFKYNKKMFREIDKLYKIMGKWDLHMISKRRFKNKFKAYFVYQGLYFLSNFSLFLFNINPKLERTLMERVKKFSYKFKFKKGAENKEL
ncbi:MAG: radical SAM protein, partial [archaeon]